MLPEKRPFGEEAVEPVEDVGDGVSVNFNKPCPISATCATTGNGTSICENGHGTDSEPLIMTFGDRTNGNPKDLNEDLQSRQLGAEIELYKALDGGYKLEDYKNTIAEPVPPKVMKHEDTTIHDVWILKDNSTLRRLLDWLQEKGFSAFGIAYCKSTGYGIYALYNTAFPRHKIEERLDKKLVDLVRDVAKEELPASQRHFDVVVTCEDDKGEDFDIPVVSVYLD